MARGRARNRRIAALGSAVLLAGGVLAAAPAATAVAQPAGKRPVATGTGGAVASADLDASRAGIRGAAPRRQCDRRGGGDGQHARRHRAVRCRSGRRRLHGHLPGQAASGDHDRRARDVPGEVLAEAVPRQQGQGAAVRERAPVRVCRSASRAWSRPGPRRCGSTASTASAMICRRRSRRPSVASSSTRTSTSRNKLRCRICSRSPAAASCS